MQSSDIEDRSLLVGIPQVDREHARLMAEIRQLTDQPAIQLDSDSFSEIISRLGHQLAQHFNHEEKIINSCGLPAHEVAAHTEAHGRIIEQYTELQLALMLGSPLDRMVVISMIESWILEHLIAFDLKLKTYA